MKLSSNGSPFTYTHEEMRQAILRAFKDGFKFAEYGLDFAVDEEAEREVERIMSQIPEEE